MGRTPINMKKAFLIHYDGYFDIRLKYVEQSLQERGFKVTLIFSDFDHYTKSSKEYPNSNVHKIHVPAYKKNISIKRIISYLSFTRQVRKLLNKEKPEFVYAIIPPNSLAKSLSSFKKCHPETKIIFDIFDLYPEQMPILSNTPVAKIWANLRNQSLKTVDFVILECYFYQKQLENFLNDDKNEVLYLNRSEILLSTNNVWQDKQIDIAYLGSINWHIDIEHILTFLKTLNQKKKVVLHIIGDGERAKTLQEELTKEAISFVFYGKVFNPEKKRQILQKCQYGLNVYRANLGIGLTMKSVEYLQYSLPLINAGIADTKQLIEEFHIGHDIDNSLEKTVDKIVSVTKEDMILMRTQCGFVFKEKFSDESYLKKLNTILDNLR
ncbi:glycosyltransferase family 4 protein [Lactococcus sp. dk322]|nr:glycosyltransferase [Lactococcus sp. dk101]TXK45605.1 glycosyltransferase family 4 protein [Lactococcus sp. dk310]TXK51455.1 glycosyltransferase family 4 protein [Lactococcus sp. dk322]